MWPYLRRELMRAVVRLALAFGLFGLVDSIAWPRDNARWIALGASAALTVAVIMICGSLLYNTLFYERYWRQTDSR